MNRLYNNEAVIMVCLVQLLRCEEMDMAKLYLYTTLLIDRQLSAFVRKSKNFDQLCMLVRNEGLISRKLDSFGPYFLNATIILKQNEFIIINDDKLRLGNSSFPEGSLKSKRLESIIKNSEHLLNMCSELSTKELYNKLNVQL